MTVTKSGPDRRVLKTKASLRDAMLALMVQRGWDDMTIQEICDMANVGRSTFYLHYQCKEDLLSKTRANVRSVLFLSRTVLLTEFVSDRRDFPVSNWHSARCSAGRYRPIRHG